MEAHLRATNWDVDAAYARWVADRQRVLNPAPPAPSSSTSSSSSSSENSDEDISEGEEDAKSDTSSTPLANRIPFNANYEQERRDAALALRLHVQESSMNTATLSPSEAVLFMHLSSWDLGEAVARFISLRNARRSLRIFDHMRTRVHQDIDRDDTMALQEQDERLAEFINITGRADWYSLRVCLQEHDWNLLAAISFWFMIGVRPVRPPRSEGVDGVRLDVNLQPMRVPEGNEWEAPLIEDDEWGPEPDYFGLDDDEGSSSEGEGIRMNRARKDGFLIISSQSERQTAKRGLPNPRKFLVEYIQKGRYWYNRFRREKKLKWPELGDDPDADDGLELFDWNNQQHVDWLNNWRRQSRVRSTGLKSRPQSQHWTQEEMDFLYALTKELLEDARRENPGVPDDDLLPMTITTEKKGEWAERMNKRFKGKTPAGASGPRDARNASALMTQRARMQSMVDDFKVTPDKIWFKKQAEKAVKAKAKADAEAKKKAKAEVKKLNKKRKASEIDDTDDGEEAEADGTTILSDPDDDGDDVEDEEE